VCVAYANHCGSEGDLVYPGESCIAGPRGEMLARAGDGETLLHADLNAEMFAKARVFNTYLTDRRPGLYSALTKAER
jgi:predicted amidohydrolase